MNKKIKGYMMGTLKVLLPAIFFILMFDTIGLKSIWMILLFVITMAIYRGYKNKELFMNTLRQVEMMIWGETLDNKEPGYRPKFKKFKLVWKRKPVEDVIVQEGKIPRGNKENGIQQNKKVKKMESANKKNKKKDM